MRARVRAIAACLLLAVAAGCKPEEHIISVTGGYSSLANFPGAKGGLKPESQVSDQEQMDRWTKLLAKNPKNVEGEAVEGRPFKDMSVSQAKQLLATTPVSISLKRNLKQFTFISAIFEFGSSFQVWAAPGAPEEYDYIPISWPG